MKTKKLMLPGMAIICAMGMAFASVDLKSELKLDAVDYVLIGGTWTAIAEQNCAEGPHTCRVKFSENGQSYDVYDVMYDDDPKPSSSKDATLIDF